MLISKCHPPPSHLPQASGPRRPTHPGAVLVMTSLGLLTTPPGAVLLTSLTLLATPPEAHATIQRKAPIHHCSRKADALTIGCDKAHQVIKIVSATYHYRTGTGLISIKDDDTYSKELKDLICTTFDEKEGSVSLRNLTASRPP